MSRTTLATWAKEGKIRYIRTGDGATSGRRYHEQDLRLHFGITDAPDTTGEGRRRLTVLYARVSSQKQKEAGDLEHQIDLLKQKYPAHDKIISDVASGLNFKRRGLISLLELVEKGHVAHVVVTYRDRLARLGVDLIERTFRKHETTLHLVSREEISSAPDDAQELADDLLAVCNYFVAKNNGRRAAALRRSRQPIESEDSSSSDEDSSSTSESDEDQTPPTKRTRPHSST